MFGISAVSECSSVFHSAFPQAPQGVTGNSDGILLMQQGFRSAQTVMILIVMEQHCSGVTNIRRSKM